MLQNLTNRVIIFNDTEMRVVSSEFNEARTHVSITAKCLITGRTHLITTHVSNIKL